MLRSPKAAIFAHKNAPSMVTDKFYFRILQGVLALLGFSTAVSCNEPDEYGPVPEEYKVLYGPPVEEYRDSTEQEPPAEAAVKKDISPEMV